MQEHAGLTPAHSTSSGSALPHDLLCHEVNLTPDGFRHHQRDAPMLMPSILHSQGFLSRLHFWNHIQLHIRPNADIVSSVLHSASTCTCIHAHTHTLPAPAILFHFSGNWLLVLPRTCYCYIQFGLDSTCPLLFPCHASYNRQPLQCLN